jgi:hypothetical protein
MTIDVEKREIGVGELQTKGLLVNAERQLHEEIDKPLKMPRRGKSFTFSIQTRAPKKAGFSIFSN